MLRFEDIRRRVKVGAEAARQSGLFGKGPLEVGVSMDIYAMILCEAWEAFIDDTGDTLPTLRNVTLLGFDVVLLDVPLENVIEMRTKQRKVA